MILGISCDYHDAAAALVVDGQVVAAVEEERFSRRKHDASLPEQAMASCLEVAGIAAADVDHVVFYEKPLVIANRFLASRRRQGPRGAKTFVQSTPELLGKNLVIGARVAKAMRRLGAPKAPHLQFVEHHRSHAAAAFFPSPHDHAAVLTIDGLGEWACASLSQGARHRLTLLEEQRYPHSLGLVYSFVTAYCGFAPNEDEYKVMGLAPYGTPRFLEALRSLVAVGDDGSLQVRAGHLGWFDPRAGRSGRLRRLFDGPPRRPGAELTPREADLAASVQALTEEAVLAMAVHAQEVTGERALCLAGGVALNCVANGRLVREGPFDEVWVQPAAGDAGGAIGAALSLWHEVLGHERRALPADAMSGGFLGPAATPAQARACLEGMGVAFTPIDDPDAIASLVAERLEAGAVVGWCTGRMEFGPRALGHRSLLADPRSPTVRARLNEAVKGRESFRPFAPAVLAEHATDWFELTGPSPYMLVVVPVRPEHLLVVGDEPQDLPARAAVARSTIPACTHVDGSARIQTVDAATNPTLHRVIAAFHARTGCPMVVNTSFNRAGEPIVATPADAIRAAALGGIDLLVLDGAVVEGDALAALDLEAT